MTKPNQHYFTDSIFQLELNLHDKRRELILMVEEFEKEDCFICLQLKCRCLIISPEKNSFTAKTCNGSCDHKNKDDTVNETPAADLLPKPRFVKEADGLIVSKDVSEGIEAWIAASRTFQKGKIDRRVSTNVASFKKCWTGRNDVNKERISSDFKKNNIILDSRFSVNAVDTFFNSFKVQPTASENIAYIANVAANYGNNKCSGNEYSYF